MSSAACPLTGLSGLVGTSEGRGRYGTRRGREGLRLAEERAEVAERDISWPLSLSGSSRPSGVL